MAHGTNMVPEWSHWLMVEGILVSKYINITRYSGLIISPNKKVKSVSIGSEKKNSNQNFANFQKSFLKIIKKYSKWYCKNYLV